jgi:hypothetical protein
MELSTVLLQSEQTSKQRKAIFMLTFKGVARAAFKSVGLDVRRATDIPAVQTAEVQQPTGIPVELTKEEGEMVEYVLRNRLSMTSVERLATTIMACKHVVSRGIQGDFVECGVWRGGHPILAAWTFQNLGSDQRVFLFDTFVGMTAPSEKDSDASAMSGFLENQRDTHNEWCYASLEDVKRNLEKAGLLNDRVVFVKGNVLDTLSQEERLPKRVSVLRLDTDWYESTKRELEILYPRLSVGGSLIIDDYGHWAGARDATEEYFSSRGGRPFLQYIDYTSRAGVKCE